MLLMISGISLLHIIKRIEANIKPSPVFYSDQDRAIEFPIDIVITWVDGQDDARNNLREEYRKRESKIVKEATSSRRYINHNELKYLLRSVERYIPWVHRIHVISSDQAPPKWLIPNEISGFDFEIKTSPQIGNKPILRWVNDRTILGDQNLPTFNSHAFETAIYKLQDLTEHFIYFCDDMFVTKPLQPSHLFSHEGKPKVCAHFWTRPYRWDPGIHSQTWRKIWSEMSRKYPSHDKWMNGHVATPLTRKLMLEAEQLWGSDWLKTRSNKFRSGSDVQPVAATVILGQISGTIIKNIGLVNRFVMFRDYQFLNRFNMAFALTAKPDLLCINNDLNQPDKYGDKLEGYLKKLLPFESIWEIT